MKRGILMASFYLLSTGTWAGVSGRLTDLCGIINDPSAKVSLLARVRLEAGYAVDLNGDWRFEVGGLGSWTRVGEPFVPSSSYDGQMGYGRLEDEWLRSDGRTLLAARLQKAFLKYARSRWEITAGRAPFAWGDSKFYKPTSIFRTERPLEAFGDPVPGVDGCDMQWTLAANTSLEGAIRVLQNGRVEWVARLENRGIGVMGTPLYARREHADGIGAEVAATFKKFQIRAEGVSWKAYGVDGRMLEMTAGFSMVVKDFPVHLEMLRDGTGEALSEARLSANAAPTYLSVMVETPRFYRVRWNPTIAKSVSEGRWLLRPGFVADLSRHLSLGVDGQWFLGKVGGTLSGNPSRMWAFVSMTL